VNFIANCTFIQGLSKSKFTFLRQLIMLEQNQETKQLKKQRSLTLSKK